MRVLLCILLACSLVVQPSLAREVFPFDPVYAADQERITNLTLEFESAQFRAIGEWHAKLDEAELMAIKQRLLREELDRAEKIEKGMYISQETYEARLLAWERSRCDGKRLRKEAERAASRALVFKFRLLAEGNPGMDVRAQVVQAKVQELAANIEGMREDVRCEKISLEMKERKRENSRGLLEKGYISPARFAEIEFEAASAANRIQVLSHQIAMEEAALEALRKTHQSLHSRSLQPDTPTPGAQRSWSVPGYLAAP